jgi:hypothetical protein
MAVKKSVSKIQKSRNLADRDSSGRFVDSSIERISSRGSRVLVIERNPKTGQFTSVESVRSINRNSEKYSAVLKRLAKK